VSPAATKSKAPKPATRRQNHGNGHSYHLDGTKVMGVTTIINQGMPKPALINWAAGSVADWVADRIVVRDDGAVDASRLVAGVQQLAAEDNKAMSGWSTTRAGQLLRRLPNRDRDAAGNKGTKVHGLGEQLVHGEEVEVPDELAGHVASYVDFLETVDPDPVMVEGVVLSRKYRYMGTFDLLAHIEGLGLCLLDLKTSRSGIFPETALQVAGYRFAEAYLDADGDEVPMPEVDFTGAVWVRADGWDLHPVRADELAFRQFLYARETAKFLDAERGTWVQDATLRGALT
jgi:hypothetical protein